MNNKQLIKMSKPRFKPFSVLLILVLLSQTYETNQDLQMRDQSFHQLERNPHRDYHRHPFNHKPHQQDQMSSRTHPNHIQGDSWHSDTGRQQNSFDSIVPSIPDGQQPVQINRQQDQQNLHLQVSRLAVNEQIPPQEQHTFGQGEAQEQHGYEYYHPGQKQFYISVGIAACLTCVGAFCSGMAIGLMSIQKIQLEIMSLSDDPQQRHIAQRILSVVSNHHLFLVTLLLFNAMALQTLPIIVHHLMPEWAAILFATFVVLIGAEIIPQAFCTGPKKITIAYYASPIILIMIKVAWIIAYPMAKGLDYLLGEHNHQRIQHKDFANFLTGGSQILNNTQKLILTSILQLRTKRVPQVMVPLSDLYMLSLKQKLTSSKIKQINQKDYSYILVYKDTRTNVVGVMKTKQFALKYLKTQKKNLIVQDLFVQRQDILCVYEDTNLLQMLMLFQTRNQRYSIVIGKKKKIEPGVQSIMYSKSDMVASNQQGQILGMVFLYRVFDMIAEYNDQIANTLNINQSPTKLHKETQMSQIKKPLMHH